MAELKMSEVLIEGVWQPARSGAEQMMHSPATLEPIARVPFCDGQDVVMAMAAARRALQNWSTFSKKARTTLLAEVGRQLADSAAAIAELQALESGQSYRECLDGALAAASCFTQLSDADSSGAREMRSADAAAGARALVLGQDYPLLHWASRAAPLLAEGSTMVCVAPRQAPLAVLRAGRCSNALPAGVLNLLVSSPEVVAAALGESATVDMTDMARNGSDAVFVSNTAGLDLALAGAASRRLFHGGQRVGQSARIYVEREMSQKLADALHEYLAFLECGDPRNPSTDLGPLRSQAALQRVEGQVARALRHGALIKMGGRRYQPWGLVGYFFQPTLLIEGRGEERVPEEEIRGPVVIISPVRSLAEALQQERAGSIAFFGQDLDVQLRSLTTAGIDFTVANPTEPLERILQSFRGVPTGPVRIETVTTPQRSWFPYSARAART